MLERFIYWAGWAVAALAVAYFGAHLVAAL
jgi:hypothetical protein